MEGGKRCRSGCKGLPEEICVKAPRCSYFNSKTKYCRLSHKYQMSKPSCTVKKRITNKNKVEIAGEIVKRYFRKTKNVSPNKKKSTPLLTPNLLDELQTTGDTPNLLEEAKTPGENLFSALQKDQSLEAKRKPLVSKRSAALESELDKLMEENESPNNMADVIKLQLKNQKKVRSTARSRVRGQPRKHRSRARSKH